MRSLLDVNVLIALLDPDHSLHQRAMPWFAKHAGEGWASCPITQNGCMRIMSHNKYPNAVPAQQIIGRLAAAAAEPAHEFWPDDVSLLDSRAVDPERIHGPRQLTDLYLLALAVEHNGRLVTFDGAIALSAAKRARPHHLLLL